MIVMMEEKKVESMGWIRRKGQNKLGGNQEETG